MLAVLALAVGTALTVAGPPHREAPPPPLVVAPRIAVEPIAMAPEPDEVEVAPKLSMHLEAPPPATPLAGLRGPIRRWYAALSPVAKVAARRFCRIQADDPCAGFANRIGTHDRPELDTLYAELSPAEQPGLDAYCIATDPSRGCNTPLVYSAGDRPIELRATPGRFAFVPGAPVSTDWPTPATPWLAIDRDGDGAITSGAELFGDGFALGDGTRARDGFAALASLDANHDGVIDRADPAFASLLLWTDRDGDRASSPGELRPLAEVVDAIPLASHGELRCNPRGDCEGARVALPGGGTIVDVYLATRCTTSGAPGSSCRD